MKFLGVPGRIILAVVAVSFLGRVGFSSFSQPTSGERGHSSPAIAIVTWPNGDSRTLRFEGVGCAISMCSRVRIQSKIKGSLAVKNTWLDSVSSIEDITDHDALFLFKDGSARRLPITLGNRFFYFGNGKIELGKLRSVEFHNR